MQARKKELAEKKATRLAKKAADAAKSGEIDGGGGEEVQEVADEVAGLEVTDES